MTTIIGLIRTGYEHWNDARALFEAGFELEERARGDLAELFLRRSIELDPVGNPGAYIALAWALQRSNSPREDETAAILDEALARTNDPLVRTWHAATRPSPDEARPLFDAILADASFEITMSVANGLIWQGENDRAWELIRDARTEIGSVEDAEALASYIGTLCALHRSGQANLHEQDVEPLLTQLQRLDPEKFATYSLAITYYRVLEDWHGALRVTEVALSTMPDEETMMWNRGDLFVRLGDDVHAEQWFLRAIGAKHTYSSARISLARLYERTGRMDDAVAIAREIPRTNADFLFGHFAAGGVLWRAGRHEEAMEMAREAADKLPPWAINRIRSDESLNELYQRLSAQKL